MTTVPGTNGVSLTDSQRYALALNAGFTGTDAITAAAISIAENPSGLTNVLNDIAPDYSIGPWQINLRIGQGGTVVGSRYGYTQQDLANPFKNADAAFQTFKTQGFGAWTTYGKGSGGMPWIVAYGRALNSASQVAARSLIIGQQGAISEQLGQISNAIGGNANTPGGGSTNTTPGGSGGIENPNGPASGTTGVATIFNTTPGLLVVLVAVILLILGAIIWGKMFSVQGPKTVIQLGSRTKTGVSLPSVSSPTPSPKPVTGYTRTRMVSPHTYHTRTVIIKHK